MCRPSWSSCLARLEEQIAPLQAACLLIRADTTGSWLLVVKRPAEVEGRHSTRMLYVFPIASLPLLMQTLPSHSLHRPVSLQPVFFWEDVWPGVESVMQDEMIITSGTPRPAMTIFPTQARYPSGRCFLPEKVLKAYTFFLNVHSIAAFCKDRRPPPLSKLGPLHLIGMLSPCLTPPS